MMSGMKTTLRKKLKAGFTIVEASLAASVMALVLGSSLSVMARGFNLLDSARAVSYASQIMQSEFEKMRLTAWGDGATGAGSGTVGGTGVSSYPTTWTNVPLDSSFYSTGDIGSRMTMQRIAAPVHDGMIQVTLKISWKTMDGRALSQSYVTYYGKNGLYDLFTY